MTASGLPDAPASPGRIPSRLVTGYVRAVSWISRAFGFVAALLLAAAMLVVCEMILMRYLFRLPTLWQTDFTVYSATAAVFLGAPYVLLTRGHVGVDVIEHRLEGRAGRNLRLLGSLLGLAFCVAMFVASAMFVHEAWSAGWRTSGVWQIPLAIPTLPLPVAFGLLCLQYLAEILRREDGSAR